MAKLFSTLTITAAIKYHKQLAAVSPFQGVASKSHL
jgi:hypothetical protein